MPLLHIQARFPAGQYESDPIVLSRQIPAQQIVINGYVFREDKEEQTHVLQADLPFISQIDVTSSTRQDGRIPLIKSATRHYHDTHTDNSGTINTEIGPVISVQQNCHYEFQISKAIPQNFTIKLYHQTGGTFTGQMQPYVDHVAPFSIDFFITYYKYNQF